MLQNNITNSGKVCLAVVGRGSRCSVLRARRPCGDMKERREDEFQSKLQQSDENGAQPKHTASVPARTGRANFRVMSQNEGLASRSVP